MVGNAFLWYAHIISKIQDLMLQNGCAGINLSLFGSYLFIRRYKQKTPHNKLIFITAVLMFCFSTIHVSLGFDRLLIGFIDLRNQPGGPGAFFSDVSIPANVAKVIIHTINSILGDSIVVSFLVDILSMLMEPIPGMALLSCLGKEQINLHHTYPHDPCICK